MPENPQAETLIHDPIMAAEMAYAENPHREKIRQFSRVATKIVDMHAKGQNTSDVSKESSVLTHELLHLGAAIDHLKYRKLFVGRRGARRLVELEAMQRDLGEERTVLRETASVLRGKDMQEAFQDTLDKIKTEKAIADISGREAGADYVTRQAEAGLMQEDLATKTTLE